MARFNGLAAFQRNWIGLFELLPDYYPAARCWRVDGCLIGISRLWIPAFNGALFWNEADLTLEHFLELDRLLRAFKVPFSIQVCSKQAIPACDSLLKAHQYEQIFADPVLIREGPLAPEAEAMGSAAAQIRPVTTDTERAAYCAIMAESFALPPALTDDFFGLLLRLHESRKMLAWLDDHPVGAWMLLYAGGVAGIYNVATLPALQRRGIGAAMIRVLHSQALADGYGATVLAASAEGLPLYRRLGYRRDGYQFGYSPIDQSAIA